MAWFKRLLTKWLGLENQVVYLDRITLAEGEKIFLQSKEKKVIAESAEILAFDHIPVSRGVEDVWLHLRMVDKTSSAASKRFSRFRQDGRLVRRAGRLVDFMRTRKASTAKNEVRPVKRPPPFKTSSLERRANASLRIRKHQGSGESDITIRKPD